MITSFIIEQTLIIMLLSFSFICLFLIYQINKLKKDYKKIKSKNILFEKYFNDLEEKKFTNKENIHQENFIKFLSESRDWAYEYIEDVQNGLESFVNAVDLDIKHFDTYGDTLSMVRPDYLAMKNISTAYKKLQQFLPEKTK
jgi:hypothetical protein